MNIMSVVNSSVGRALSFSHERHGSNLAWTFVIFIIDLRSNWLLRWWSIYSDCWWPKLLTVPCMQRETIYKLWSMYCICNPTCMYCLVNKGQTSAKSNNVKKINEHNVLVALKEHRQTKNHLLVPNNSFSQI
jgi:hypothetical protein